MFIAHTGYLELFDLVVKHILPGMGLFFYFVLHFNCKFAAHKKKHHKKRPVSDGNSSRVRVINEERASF